MTALKRMRVVKKNVDEIEDEGGAGGEEREKEREGEGGFDDHAVIERQRGEAGEQESLSER
eukprot:3814308-Pleurochrysis_carterae.AAC.1